MPRFFSFLAVITAFTLTWTTFLCAQNAPITSDSTGTLEAITVTSTRVTRDLSEVPLSISVISAETISDQPKADIIDYLREVPGFQMATGSYAQPQFSLRGNGSDRTMILIDGVRQRMATTLLTEESGNLNIDSSEIERIEVIKGPASALYGSDAIGGVINIITKKESDRPFGFGAGLIYDGSVKAINPKVSVYGGKSGFYFRVTASTFNAGELKINDHQTFWHSQHHHKNFSGKFGYRWDKGSLDFTASRYQGWRNIPGLNTTTGKQVPPSSFLLPTGSRYSSVPEEWRNSLSATLTLNDLTPYMPRLLVTTYYIEEEYEIDFNLNRFSPDGTTILLAGSSNVLGVDHGEGFGASVLADLTVSSNNLLTLGFDFENTKAHSTGLYSGRVQQTGTKDEDRQGYSRSWAVFAQDEWKIIPNLALTVGLRYTSTQNAITKDAAYPQRVKKGTENNFVMSAGVVYSGIENLSLRALYSQGFRAPTLSAQMGKTQRSLPADNLKPETSNNFEIGARYSGYGLTADLALFYSLLDNPFFDKMTTVPHPASSFYTRTENAYRAKSYGAELYLDYNFYNLGLTPYLSFTAMTYERELSPGLVTKNTGVPSSWGTGGLKFTHQINDTIRFFSDASITWSGGHQNIDYSNMGSATYAPLVYSSGWKTDVTIGLEVGQEKKTKATLSFKNIGDRTFEPWGYYQPGFHLVGSLAYEF
ncbi:MAG: TonB-dependent receptor [Deltaproteobacteria bacterium]|jgi:hemoglobin/transferrin/lactoferrin receptor protein|nr:TonB-dependent receptor [Deltaproteobacteria bacterium]